uniref:Toxin candidate TRINITY_DN31244_c0_g1_i1 n=1 Tax=Pachycerianthus maua TaxID=2736681 RepID=A0A7G7WZ42_9CNID|nr:toxin candidate TRINITY_DN31244_c0_g1_i1 [Pachycerianthus maua]
MQLVRYILGVVLLSLFLTQVSLAQKRNEFKKRVKKISRKVKGKLDSSVSENGDVEETEEELERQILEGRVENQQKKKAKKVKKSKAFMKKKALKKKKLQKKKQKEVEVPKRRGFVRKTGSQECVDKLESEVSTFNCTFFLKLRFCEHEDYKERMKDVCAKTCGLCPAPAQPIIRTCESSKFGCCWDNSDATGPGQGEGCPDCVNDHPHLCQQFRANCNDMTDTGIWLRKKCPAKCRICEQPKKKMDDKKRRKMKRKMKKEKEQKRIDAIKRFGYYPVGR